MYKRGAAMAAIPGGNPLAMNGGIGNVEGAKALDFLGAECMRGYDPRYDELVQCIRRR